jgi:hypothetical protein
MSLLGRMVYDFTPFFGIPETPTTAIKVQLTLILLEIHQ